MKGRVRRPQEHSDLLNKLKDEGLFDTLKSALVFAASVGAAKGVKNEMDSSAEPIAIDTFSDDLDIPFMFALALVDTGDPAVLKEDQYDQVIAIFEQYATGGLAYLKGTLDYANLQASIENLVFSEEQGEQPVEPIW